MGAFTWNPNNSSGGAGPGTGDVVGPASATDNALARYDGTTGKLLQNSLVRITDDGRAGIGDLGPQNYTVLELGSASHPSGLTGTIPSVVSAEQVFDPTIATVGIAAFSAFVTTSATVGTIGVRTGFFSWNAAKGAGSTINYDTGCLFRQPTQGTNNAAIYLNAGNVYPSFTGDYAIYSANTNPSLLSGTLTKGSLDSQVHTTRGNDSFPIDISTFSGTSATFGNTPQFRKLTNAGTKIMQGITAGVNGQLLTFMNEGGNFTVANEEAAATAANRIITGTGGDIVITGDGAVNFYYDSDSSRWRVTSYNT